MLITSSGLGLLRRLPGGTKLDVAAAARVVTAVMVVSDATVLLHDAAIALPLLVAETTLPAKTNAETESGIATETTTTAAAPAAQLIETVTAT